MFDYFRCFVFIELKKLKFILKQLLSSFRTRVHCDVITVLEQSRSQTPAELQRRSDTLEDHGGNIGGEKTHSAALPRQIRNREFGEEKPREINMGKHKKVK